MSEELRSSSGEVGARTAFPRPFGRYVLERSLSRGGMGDVFLAIARGVKQRCVVKTIRTDLDGEDEFVGRFTDEAKIMVRMQHPNIIRVFDCGKVSDTYYIAMEYVHGFDMGDVLDRAYERGRPLALAAGLHIAAKVLSGLDHVHSLTDERGRHMSLVHRDISPQNVLVGMDGSVRLIDFGLARSALLPGRTLGALAIGKFGYMSPEQARHQPLDGRADLYATGVMLFEVFTSERLVDEQDQKTLWKRVLNPDHRAPRSVIPSLPASVDALIAKATATSPDDRFANAPSMLAAVSDIERELGSLGYGQRALVRAMKELYPNIPDYLPPMPDVSGVPADTSLIIASSKAKLRSVFGRGDLPVEGTLEFDRSSLPFAREEALAQAETVDMDGEEDTVTDVDDWPGVEALARVRRSLPRPPTQETDPSFVPPVRRTGSLVGSRIALQTVDRPPVPTPPSIEAEVCAPAEAPPATPSWTIALAVGGAVSLLGYLVWSTLT